MPFGDGTGPRGMGSMTGRGAGYCAGFGGPGFANPVPGRGWFGFGLGWRRQYGHPYPRRYGAGIPRAGYGYPYYGGGYAPFHGRPYGYPAAPFAAVWPW